MGSIVLAIFASSYSFFVFLPHFSYTVFRHVNLVFSSSSFFIICLFQAVHFSHSDPESKDWKVHFRFRFPLLFFLIIESSSQSSTSFFLLFSFMFFLSFTFYTYLVRLCNRKYGIKRNEGKKEFDRKSWECYGSIMNYFLHVSCSYSALQIWSR